MLILNPPESDRFQSHVAFDSLVGESTKINLPSLTLNVKHKGYQAKRRSRTFMAGVDENAYSDYALQWLLDELVDDGDEIVCVRVVEKDFKAGDKHAHEDAEAVMRSILEKNGANRAISVVLEYAYGKLPTTFQKLIRMYQPAMLIVGTRGRSLGGFQGLVNSRASFSKYCLQYSPVPVVVVRPTDKRLKKKEKRANDPTRQSYASMLTHGKHEADAASSAPYEFEVKLSADEEAHQVARVLGLPASFDPTLKPIDAGTLRMGPGWRHSYGGGARTTAAAKTASKATTASTTDTIKSDMPVAVVVDNGVPSVAERGTGSVPPSPGRVGGGSGEDDDEDEDDDDDGAEFDVVSGEVALENSKKEKLHAMEVNEAAALKCHPGEEDEEDED